MLVSRVDPIDAPGRLVAEIKDFSLLDEQVRHGLARTAAQQDDRISGRSRHP